MEAVIAVYCCWVVFHIYQGGAFADTVLYTTSVPAFIGHPLTLVCTWSEVEARRPNASKVQWIKGVDPFLTTDIGTCTADTRVDALDRVTVGYGYLYQSLTIRNITSDDGTDSWYCNIGDALSKTPNITVKNGSGSFMSTKQPVTNVGSTFTLNCSLDNGNVSFSSWYMDDKLCFRLGKLCQVDVQTDCSDMTQNLTETCTRHFHAVTFHNASLSNQDVMWSCDIEGKRSNSVRVIVLDTDMNPIDRQLRKRIVAPTTVQELDQDFTKSVTISGNEETGNDLSDPITLSCRSRCHALYEFRWTVDSFPSVDQNTSNTDYDSCNSVCRQNLTLYTGDVIQDIQVTCSVSDNSGRAGTDAYSIAGVVESSTVTDKWVSHRSISWYVWVGVAVGGVAIFAVVVATVAIVYKRRSLRGSSTALVMKNVLYESAEPCLQNATGNASKAEMQDNFLYERTGDMLTQDTNKIVMEENILYEKTEDST